MNSDRSWVLFNFTFSDSIHRWSSNLCFYTIHWVETRENFDTPTRDLNADLDLAKRSRVEIGLTFSSSFKTMLRIDPLQIVWLINLIEFVRFDWSLIVRSKLCFSIQIDLYRKCHSFSMRLPDRSAIYKTWPGLYESWVRDYSESWLQMNYDSCPIWSQFALSFFSHPILHIRFPSVDELDLNVWESHFRSLWSAPLSMLTIDWPTELLQSETWSISDEQSFVAFDIRSIVMINNEDHERNRG